MRDEKGRHGYREATKATLAIMSVVWLVLTPRAVRTADGQISITSLEVQQTSLQLGGPTANVASASRPGNGEIQVREISKIRLHHHDQDDHIVYIARAATVSGAWGRKAKRPVP